jgi:hypothetical protein
LRTCFFSKFSIRTLNTTLNFTSIGWKPKTRGKGMKT